MHKFILTTSLALLFSIPSFSQSNIDWTSLKFKNDSTNQREEYKITIEDGTIIYGVLERLTTTQLFVETNELGTLALAVSRIVSIEPRNAELIEEGRSMVGVNHYLIAPSPYGLEQDEFNLQFSEVFLFSGWYGLSDNFTLGGGFTLIPAIDFSDQLFYLIPKMSFDLAPGIRASAQLTYLTTNGESTSLLSLTAGFGKPDSHFSIGYSSSLTDNVGGAINSGFVLRVSEKFGVLADGYFFTEETDENLIGFGARFIGRSSSFDFGFLTIPDSGVGAIPWINYTIRL